MFPEDKHASEIRLSMSFSGFVGEGGKGRAGCVKVLHNLVSHDSLDRLRKRHSCKLCVEGVCMVEDVCIDRARHPPFCGR